MNVWTNISGMFVVLCCSRLKNSLAYRNLRVGHQVSVVTECHIPARVPGGLEQLLRSEVEDIQVNYSNAKEVTDNLHCITLHLIWSDSFSVHLQHPTSEMEYLLIQSLILLSSESETKSELHNQIIEKLY